MHNRDRPIQTAMEEPKYISLLLNKMFKKHRDVFCLSISPEIRLYRPYVMTSMQGAVTLYIDAMLHLKVSVIMTMNMINLNHGRSSRSDSIGKSTAPFSRMPSSRSLVLARTAHAGVHLPFPRNSSTRRISFICTVRNQTTVSQQQTQLQFHVLPPLLRPLLRQPRQRPFPSFLQSEMVTRQRYQELW